jgi:hypothetical protein
MNLRPISLGLRSNPARSGYAGAARLINCFAEEVGEEGIAPWNVIGCSGFDNFSTLTDGGAVRAMLALDDAKAYVVSGRGVYRVDAGGSSTLLGGFPTAGFCTMARNRKAIPEVAIVSDGLVYQIVSDVLTQVSDPDLPPATSVAGLNGYFVFQLTDGRMFSSGLDEIDVGALDFAAASSDPDNAMRVYARGQDLLSFGTRSLEFWQDAGAETFPFSRVTSRQIGMLASSSVADIDQTCAWVAHDGTVRMLQGYDGVRISTHAVERSIKSDPLPAGITACSWQELGHSFYALSGTAWTWVYDATTRLWHERESYGEGRWRIGQALRFAGRTVLGDYELGRLYTLDDETYSEAGAHLVTKIVTPPITNGGQKFRLDRVELDMETGIGLASALEHEADPQVMLDYTRDGVNYSAQRMMSAGRMGQSMAKVFATRLGQHDSVSLRFSISAPVRRRIIGTRVGVS